MTEERLKELEELCERFDPLRSPEHGWDGFLEWQKANADFIAESRTAIPELIAEIRRLREQAND